MASNPFVTILPTTYFIIFIFIMGHLATTNALPFVVFHGIADECSSVKVTNFTQNLINWSSSEGYCIEIGNGFLDSFFMPVMNQTKIACEKVKSMSELSDGYNIVAISQGNLVGRGVIEFCDGGPPVKNFIALGGPHAGVAAPPCSKESQCKTMQDILVKLGVYSKFAQEHLAPAGFIKIPTEIPAYLQGSEYLPKLNNEISNSRNSVYKERFTSLENLVLIMFDQDAVLVPKETSWFGYYPEGSLDTVLPVNETTLYKEDWIGLKTMVEAGHVKFIEVSGQHVDISENDMKKYVVPYI